MIFLASVDQGMGENQGSGRRGEKKSGIRRRGAKKIGSGRRGQTNQGSGNGGTSGIREEGAEKIRDQGGSQPCCTPPIDT